jgi:hypothetical protein
MGLQFDMPDALSSVSDVIQREVIEYRAHTNQAIKRLNPLTTRLIRVRWMRGSTKELTGGVHGWVRRGSTTREYEADDVLLGAALSIPIFFCSPQ